MKRRSILPGLALHLCAATVGFAQVAPSSSPLASPPESSSAAPFVEPTRVAQAIAEYRRTGYAATIPPIGTGEFTAFPYGHSRPLLRCAALRLCMIELQSGETLTDKPLIGDPVRWDVDQTQSGEEEPTVQVLVRPRRCDTSTNIVIPTSRRRYVVEVEAPSCAEESTNPRSSYMVGIKFYYPDEDGAREEHALDAYRIDPLRVNSAYRWDLKPRVTWTPIHVFDDGIRTFIKLSAEARHGEMPLVYLVAADGKRELLNSVVRAEAGGDYLVLDRVVRRAVLVATSGRSEQRVRILNLLPNRSETR